MSTFNPDSFLDTTTTDSLTKRPPLPAGKEYTGVIKDIKMREWTGKKDPTAKGIAADVQIEIDLTAYPDDHVALGIDSVLLTDGIMLDTTDSGSLDMSPGRNGKLRRYRDALGMNVAGQSFSLRMMVGRMIKTKIKNEVYEGEVYDRVDGISKA